MLLLRGATSARGGPVPGICVSIHAPLARSNKLKHRNSTRTSCFNTCSSCEEQRCGVFSSPINVRFNTCSSCEEQRNGETPYTGGYVSIHAPLARSNHGLTLKRFAWRRSFNTCSSCEEQRGTDGGVVRKKRFNTCSSCEEQLFVSMDKAKDASFNTCSSCEEQPGRSSGTRIRNCFNTCSSCEEQLSIPYFFAF